MHDCSPTLVINHVNFHLMPMNLKSKESPFSLHLSVPLFHQQASKEGNRDVTAALKQTLEAAMRVKQRSLRPEIQLLNHLLADKSFADRAVVGACTS